MQPEMTMTMERAKNITRSALLAFVLVSIGFVLGKEMTARRQTPATGPESPASVATSDKGVAASNKPVATDDKVVVYYLHTTFRCVTCNEIERLTKALVETEFADDLAAGRIQWREANFQQDESLAKRYEVVSSCVVVANIQGGKEREFQRLDDVWTRYQDPADFNGYVGAAIRKYLKERGE
jgi:hypothetical protein